VHFRQVFGVPVNFRRLDARLDDFVGDVPAETDNQY
jgi:hypothetical protein